MAVLLEGTVVVVLLADSRRLVAVGGTVVPGEQAHIVGPVVAQERHKWGRVLAEQVLARKLLLY